MPTFTGVPTRTVEEQMSNFDWRAAKCTKAEDRRIVQHQMCELFREGREMKEVDQQADHQQTSSTAMGEPDADALPHVSDEPCGMLLDEGPLDAFNAFIRGSVRTFVLDRVGGEMHVPYSLCLVAALPTSFYSLVDISYTLANEELVRASGLSSVEAFACANCLSWPAFVLLILPIYYPIYLRMLKHALYIQSRPLRLVLTIVSGTATHAYGAACMAIVESSATLCVQQAAFSWVLPLVLLLLLLQLRCLFHGGGHSSPGIAGRVMRIPH